MRLIIAGGGTGGHLFPGIAVAQEFLERDKSNEVLFVGTRKGIESRVLRKEGYGVRFIEIEGIKGRGVFKGIEVLGIKLPKSLYQAYRILKGFSPDLVLGVGGYAAGPLVFMAWIMGFSTAIHEQNSIPGLTNRILGRFVDRIFISFPETSRWFPPKKSFLTGNPVRKELLLSGPDIKEDERFTLLILGGSQGAHEINLAVLDAMDYLSEFTSLIKILHQSGDKDYGYLSEAYKKRGIDALVLPFIEDMRSAYARADLVICRAGAMTLSELALFGKPSILIPLPRSAHNHQDENARIFERIGAARVLESPTGRRLAEVIKGLYNDRGLLKRMGLKAREMARPYAAKEMVDILCTRR